MYTDHTIQPAPIRRVFIEEAIIAHRGYFERARRLLRAARTPDEVATARYFMTSASGELTRWQAALEACDG